MMKIVLQVSGNIGAAAADPATYGFIGSGFNNRIDTAAGAGTTFGVIGGGEGNYIAPGTNHSSIFSGNGNQVSGSCSAVLGGANNSDGGIPYVGMYGNGLLATVDPTTYGVPSVFMVDSIVAPNIPDISEYGSLPSGAIYSVTTGIGPGSKQLFIR